MSWSPLDIRYKAPGPVAARFMFSDEQVRAIMGPIGSGKTGACLMDHVRRAGRQTPSTNGVRYYKFAVIRDTARQLEKTTLPSWLRWVPKETGEFTGGDGGRPATHRLLFGLPDGSQVDLIVEFIGLGEQAVEDAMRGWEGTGAYINETDLVSETVLTYVRGRCGRYPARSEQCPSGASWYGVTCDFNAPDTDSWVYRRFVDMQASDGRELGEDGGKFFRQPSGLSPAAENLPHLPEGYYRNQMADQPAWYIKRMIKNEFGFSREGQPCYGTDWNDEFHVAEEELVPQRGLRIIAGVDAGLMPAMVLGQQMASGQWRIYDELVGDHIGATKFAEAVTRLRLERYRDFKITGWGDPSANAASATEKDERSWLQVFGSAAELAITGAPTNVISSRLEAVRVPLTRPLEGRIPGLLLSPRCKILRKGFNSGYRFRRVKVSGVERYEDDPEKNSFSHPHDALQYLLSGGGEHWKLLLKNSGDKKGFNRELKYPKQGIA